MSDLSHPTSALGEGAASPDAAPSDKTQRLASDRLVAQQKQRWSTGETILVEHLLAEQPGLPASSETVLDLIYNEVLLREQRGAKPLLAEYVARFPHLEAELALQFEVDEGFARELDALPPTVRGGEDTSPRAVTTESQSAPGLQDYEILQELGRGGMGVVYKARQRSLNRIVALKMVLSGSFAGPQDLARLRAEAAAAARLQHPNIVQVFEIGECDGRPYFSLEYVAGGSLAQKLKGTPPTPADAARLIETLARAIDHAHGNGIVHRDLKPANILLAGVRGQGLGVGEEVALSPLTPNPQSLAPNPYTLTPKITDFGLAKWLDRDSQLTRTGDILGTPSYMAPEQAGGGSACHPAQSDTLVSGPSPEGACARVVPGRQTPAIGPATDVYALGAILYELLTGRPPFRSWTTADTVLQVLHAEPVAPRRLQPAVPLDLETICLKCLEKDPGKRYASGAALADDLQRFQAGLPILARPVGSWQRLVKWARRRPAVAALVAVSVSAILALTVGGWWSYLSLKAAAGREARERLQAEENFRQALEAVDQMLTEVGDVDLANVPHMEHVRKKLLARAQGFYERFVRHKGDDMSVRREAGRAQVRLGDIRDLLGEQVEAEKCHRAAVDMLEPLAARFGDVAAYRQDLARAHHSLSILWRKTNRFVEAEGAIAIALRLRQQLADEHPADPDYRRELAASAYHQGALLARLAGRQQEAEKAYQRALDLQRHLVDTVPGQPALKRDLARTFNNLGILLHAAGRPDAGAHFAGAAALQQELAHGFPGVAAYRWDLARYQNNLASQQRSQGAAALADKTYGAALTLLTKLAADFPTVPDYRQELAATHSNLGLLLQTGKQWAAAEVAYREALALRRQLVDLPDHRHKLAETLSRLGFLLSLNRRGPEAAACYAEAIRLHEQLAAEFPKVASYRSGLGSNLNHRARLLVAQGTWTEPSLVVALIAAPACVDPGQALPGLAHASSALHEARTTVDRAIDEHRHALAGDPSNVFHRQYLRDDYFVRTVVLLELGEHQAAAAQAEELPRLYPSSKEEHVRAAEFVAKALALAQRDSALTEEQRQQLRSVWGRRIVEHFEGAVARGFADARELRQPLYAPLQSRSDYQGLLRRLEGR